MYERAGQPAFFEDLNARWMAMPMASRFGVVALALAAVGVFGLLILWIKRPDYRPLYSHLKAEDAAGVTRKLKELKVPYELENDGETVLVPAASLYQSRLELAGAGLPERGSIGFDLFDKTRFQTSALSERVTYLRALQGELCSTIGSMDEVESVRVHLALPTRDIFMDDKKSATASVVLKLHSGMRLLPTQVRSITALVAGSVEGMTTDRVMVMDTAGNTLTAGDDTAPLVAAGTLMELQQSEEKHMEERAQQLLDRVLGPGKGVVRVSLQLATDQKTTDSHQWVPSGDGATGVVRSTQTLDEGYQNSGNTSLLAAASSTTSSTAPLATPTTTPSAAPSTAASPSATPAATPAKPTAPPAGKQPQYSHKVITTNYEISQTEEHKVEHPGAIKRMTVAVVLAKETNLPKDAVEDLKQLIERATGADKTRDDVVTVAFLPFSKPEVPAETADMAKDERMQLYLSWARAGAPVASVLLFWIIGGIVTRRRSMMMMAFQPPRVTTISQPAAPPPSMPQSMPRMPMVPEMTMPEPPRPSFDMHQSATMSPSMGAPRRKGTTGSLVPPEESGDGSLDPKLVALANVDATAQLIERWMQMEKDA